MTQSWSRVARAAVWCLCLCLLVSPFTDLEYVTDKAPRQGNKAIRHNYVFATRQAGV